MTRMTMTRRRLALALAAVVGLPPTARAAEPHWPETLTIGTGSPGGTYYDYGEGLAKLLTRRLELPVFARPTEGPTENIALLEAGAIELGFVTLGIAQQAWNGRDEWTGGKQFRAMRAVFPMYDTPFQFMALRESGLLSVADLAGKRVGIGPSGGTTGIYMPDFFKVLKIDAALHTGSWSELAAAIEARALDALAVGAGVPFPEFAASVVPAGSYPSLTRHYQTVGLYNFAVARSSLPDDLVYAIAEAVFSGNDELMQASKAAAETVPANFTRNTLLPFHPGAMRWYASKATAGVLYGD